MVGAERGVTVDEELEVLRSDLQGCRMVAFVDLTARLVLVAKSDAKPLQETLDALAETGARLLPMREGAVSAAMADARLPDQALVLREDGLSAYVRTETDPAEVLYCDCERGADPDTMLTRLRATLERIAAEG